MAKDEALFAKLAAAGKMKCGVKLKVEALFGDRPDIKAAISSASADGASPRTIARILAGEGYDIKEGAVANWLEAQREG